MRTKLFIVSASTIVVWAPAGLGQQQSYGVDYSWPMHHLKVMSIPSSEVNVLGDRQAAYDSFMEGCDKLYNRQPSPCQQVELDRIQMNLDQPKSMQNYTEMGFKKIKCPESVYKLVKEFWDQNRNNGDEEQWFTGNTYTNHWESKSYLISVENTKLRGGGGALQNAIWDAARSTIEEWTGEELTPCSLYGIRVYGNGAILAPHVDRLPLVSSAIINVDQDLDVTIHLRQNVAVKLRSLLIRLQTNTPPICKMFQQIEWEADTTSLAYVCTDTCAGTYFYWVFSFQSHPLGFSKSIPQSPA